MQLITRPFARLLPALLTFALLLAATGAGATAAVLPAGYDFRPLGDYVQPSNFKTSYDDRVLGIATGLNNNGQILGFWLSTGGVFHGHAIQFGSNPLMSARDTENFVALSGSDVTCRSFFGVQLCNIEYPFGVRVIPPVAPATASTGVTAFVSTPTDVVTIAGSLPFSLYPGNFVDENKNGVVATTQLTATGQYGVLVYSGGQTALSDVPWLIAINDLSEPLVLAYDGADGGCVVYGPDCAPTPAPECEDDDSHHDHGIGVGHEEHGNGNGYGHDECPDKVDRHATGGTGALLIRLLTNGTALRYQFPGTVVDGDAVRTVANVFPLAINDTRAILRGDISVGRTKYEKRLLSCVLNPAALDPGADGMVDCTGGMTVIGGIAGSIRVGTVLGFSMNNAGVLAGNLGFNEAGTGTPFVLDVTAVAPTAALLGNFASGTDSWEINTITDMNLAGRMVGYGYKNCSALPEAFYVEPVVTAPASALRFGRGAFESPGYLVARNAPLAINPTLSGGSGNYELRVYTRKPTDTDWTLLADWSATTALYNPGTYRGDICFRIEARDAGAPAAVQRTVMRYSVIGSVPPAGSDEETPGGDDSGTGSLTASTGSFRIADLLGTAGGVLLFALLALGLRRRTR